MKTRSVFALCSAMLLPVFTFAADLVSDYTVDGTTYARSEGWLALDVGMTIVMKYENLPAEGDATFMTLSQYTTDNKESKVGLCSRARSPRGMWNGSYWNDTQNTSTATLDESGVVVCVYKPVGGDNNQGLLAYDSSGALIFSANKLKSSASGSTVGKKIVITEYVTDVAVYKGEVAAEDISALVTAFNQPSATSVYEPFLTTEYVKTTIRAESLEDLLVASYSATMKGDNIGGGSVEATGYFVTKSSDNELTVELQAINGETKCVLLKLMLDDEGYVSVKAVKAAWMAKGTALGTQFFEDENKVSSANDATVVTSTTGKGYGIAELTITGKNVVDTKIPDGTLKYGYDFNGGVYQLETGATGNHLACGDIAADISGDALNLGSRAGKHYGTGFSYGDGAWSIAIVSTATSVGEVIYAVGGQRGTVGLIGLRNAGDNTIEAFTKEATKLTSVTLTDDPKTAYHLYTIVYSASKLRMNVDGGAFTDAVDFTTGTGDQWQFGGIHGGFSGLSGVKNATSGLLDEFRVYTMALNRAQTYKIAEEFGLVGDEEAPVFDPENDEVADFAALRLSEIMPKPVDKPVDSRGLYPASLARYDANGLESGWVELENTSDKWVNLADYKFIRVNRSKANSKGDFGNFPEVMIPPHAKYVFYTSERYSNSADMTVSAWVTPHPNGVVPVLYGDDLHNMLVWPDKINPKKFAFVRLYYAPAGVETSIVDTVVIPSDIPEGYSIIIPEFGEDEATIRYMTNAPTKGKANPIDLDKLVKLGPNVGPLYEIAKGAKHNSVSEFGATPPAKSEADYEINFSLNPTMSPTEAAGFRGPDMIAAITLQYRAWDEKGPGKIKEKILEIPESPTFDAKDLGYKYSVTIPSADLPAAGQLVQWKFKIRDAAGNEWTTPSFHNPDDGYEWYGTIVEPNESQTSAKLPTWHMFVDPTPINGTQYSHLTEMDRDADFDNKKNLGQHFAVVPHNARVAIYDSTTSNYYDYVRIDLRGNTSAAFNKKSHGLRFGKAHPLMMYDIVRGENFKKEIRKSSLIGEPADPSFMRQMIGFWLWNKMGNLTPFDFPIRCNLNGAFYQLAFHSERFTDELIEDVYGLDKYGYGYKNVGTLKSGSSTTAGSIEKKTPDDGKDDDISVLQDELRGPMDSFKVNTEGGTEDNAELTKFVVKKFNLPAWINYLASARITQEMDDVWANISVYYDNAEMKEGERGTGTWMPLGYDFNVSFGQYYHDSGVNLQSQNILMANQDWFKSHPFYSGKRVRCHGGSFSAGLVNDGNMGLEAVLQNSKFRRLYLRRLRTLMDQELKAPGANESDIPMMVKMRELAELMSDDAALDREKWGWSSSFGSIDAWGEANWPANIHAGITDLFEKYIQPRQVHLFETHSINNTEFKVGYGEQFNAGIPNAQSPIGRLKNKITVNAYTTNFGQYAVIENTNEETIDVSGWKLSGPISMTLPPGTVVDAMIGGLSGKLYVVVDRRSFVTNMERVLSDQIIIGNGVAGDVDSSISLRTATGERVVGEPSEQEKSLRLFGFCGVPNGDAGTDVGEFVILTNLNQSAELDASGVIVHFNKNAAALDDRAKIVLPSGTKIAAGGWLRLDQSWEKITDGNIDIWLYDNNGSTISEWTNLSQSTLGVKASGYYAKYDFVNNVWDKDIITNAPGYVAPEPPPVDPVDPEEGEVLEGEFTETVELAAGNYVLSNATFTAGLTLTGAAKLSTYPETENSISSLITAGTLTLAGSGTLTLTGTPTLTTNLMKVTGDLIVESGTFNIVAEGPEPVVDTDKFAAVLVTGKFLQTGGTVNVELSGTKVYGISLDTKNMTATIEGGAFNATIGGTSCSALKLKGSCTGSFKGGVVTGVLSGAGAKIFNGGSQTYSGGEYTVSMPVEATEATDVKPFCADRTLVISDGMFDIKIPTEGSEAISTAGDGDKNADLTISGGIIKIEAGDDPINSAMNIYITGGFVHAVSTYSDALDSNGSMTITGGYVFAFTKSSEHEALDVIPAVDNGLTHTLTIGKGATVLAVGGKQIATEILGDAATLKVDAETEETDQKYVLFDTATIDTDANTKTTRTFAVNWSDKHVGGISDGETFAVMIAAEEVGESYTKGKNPDKNLTKGYAYLEPSYDKIIVKIVSVEDLTPPGPDYPEGALVITEPGDYTELIEGDKAVVVDVGEGNTVTFTQANSFTGGLYVYSGTAAQTYRSTNNSRFGGFGANNFDDLETMCHIYVKEGATLDLANTVDACYIIHSAGTIVNSGSAMGVGSRQITQLILDGDTTIKGNTFGIVRSGHNPATLDLGGYTLTLDLASETTQFVTAALTIMNPGVIKIKNGQFFIKADKAFAVENGAQVPLDVSQMDGDVVVVSGKAEAFGSFVVAEGQNGWSLDATSGNLNAVFTEPTPVLAEEDETAEEIGLMISEIMPKASVWDENDCEAGWLEVVNVSQKNVNFGDYTIARFNRGKAVTKLTGWKNSVKKLLAPGERLVIKTSEDYPHADDKTITQYEDKDGVIVLASKVNPKKYPMVVLVKGGKVVQRCVVPVDVPEDKSVCFDGEDLNGAKVSRICTATMGTRNALRSGIPVGPQISPLYGVADAEDYWTAFDKATVGTDYTVSVPVNPIVGGNEKNEIAAVNLIYQIGWGEIVTNEVAMVKAETEDPLKGAVYSGAIPGAAIQGEGQLVRWAVKITDKAGNAWRSPSFNNPEDGFEWYGTITTPSESQTEGGITTFHLFIPEDIADGCGSANAKPNCLMNIDADNAAYTSNSKYPYGAYVGIYDNDTGMYYDKVRIDKRGNTSGSFTKKAHGLKFAKAQSFKGIDSVTGKEIECRKSSFTAEYADPSFVRQGLSFKTLNDNGSKAPFHYPVRLNLNGEFYQLAFHTERFSDELIEDFYGLDPKGYGYKNIGPFNPGVRPVSGGIEKKTPDDGVTSDGDILNEFCAKMADCERISEDHTKGDPTPTADSEFETEFSKELTKVVATDFDLPAWLNYIALTKITGETDDVWANLSGYYDVNGTGTWMPLAYDMNQSFGQWHLSDDWDYDFGDKCPATDDHHKAHPLYGGLHIMVHYSGGAPYNSSNNKTSATKPYKGNRCFESIFQNAKYRRLYLRRLRTLMDAEFGGSTADQEHTPIYQRAKAMVERFSAVAAMDRKIWTDYQTQSASAGLWVFGYKPEGWTAEQGLEWMWDNYIVPRRQHLYVTHGISDPEGKGIGYGETKCAGIPAAQSAILSLRDQITAEYDAAKKAVVIRNANAETIDLSNWKLEGPVNMTLPAGTIIDQAVDGIKGELFVSFDRKATVAAFGEDLHDQIIVGNGTFGKETAAIALTAADETKVIFTPTPEYYYLRLHSFDGVTPVADADSEEWLTLTNLSDSVTLDLTGVRVRILKDTVAEDQAQMDITLTDGTIAPSGTIKLTQADFASVGWSKITNNKIHIAIWDANSARVQYAFVAQKDYKSYYGDAGSKTAPIGGKFYLEATSFGETLAQADFKEVAYPVTTKTWEEATEITDETPMSELLPEAQATTLVNLGVKPTTLANWAKSHHATDTLGTEINLEAFALDCAPSEVATKKEAFTVTITFAEDGSIKIDPTIKLNIKPTIQGSTDLETWHNKTDGDSFFKAVIQIGE